MKNLLILFFLLFSVTIIYAQSATDFTTNDCNGVSHNLFDKLDNGEVVVLCWVMPCGPCATYAEYALNAVQSFSSSHPAKVKFYIADDFANTNCQTLMNWSSSFNLTADATFSSSSINMNDYGGPGMPKVVVIGKNNYNVYYNGNNTNISYTGVYNAINLAINESASLSLQENFQKPNFYPNPTSDFLNLSKVMNDLNKIEIYDSSGKGIWNFKIENNKVDVSQLASGIYFLKYTSDEDNHINKFFVNK